MDGVHVAHHGQDHVGRRIERLVAVIQRLRRDVGNALHRARDGGAGGAGPVQCLQHAGIDLPVGVVLDHADLLGDDALLLGDALLRKIGNGYEGQQDL